MNKAINAFDYAGYICKAMTKGILLTTKRGDEVNTMTIGWGHMGIEWGKPIFVAYIRDSRHTRKMLDDTYEFTVNIPYESVDAHILGYCGSKSGRDVNKICELNLTTVESEHIGVPGIRELPITLECKVIYRQKQDMNGIPADIQTRYYPSDVSGNQDYHIAYYGEIVGAYLIEE
ncbi:MAG: flavin reductase family protein [Oscillospiraceae bacterium]|nr:flavin reductase family protein [Oscillospiraceae bacterium]